MMGPLTYIKEVNGGLLLIIPYEQKIDKKLCFLNYYFFDQRCTQLMRECKKFDKSAYLNF